MNPMDWKLTYDPENELVRLEISGSLRSQVVRQAAIKSVEMAKVHQCSKYLIKIGDALMHGSTVDIYQVMSRLHDLGFQITDRIAMISANSEKNCRFAETVAHNRGWERLIFFRDMNTAEQWLKSNPE
jgi:hypothetical protein